MEITKYADCTGKELMEIEKQLDKKLNWFNEINYTRWERLLYSNSTDSINNAWKKNSFWRLPDRFHWYKLSEEYHSEFYGKYKLPVNVLASEPFFEFLDDKTYLKIIDELRSKKIDSSKGNLMEQYKELSQQINELQDQFFRDVLHLPDQMREKIDNNTSVLENYDPFIANEEGNKNLHKIEYIARAESTYRGIICGSIYAYEWMIGDYLYTNFEIIEELRKVTDDLLALSKKFLSVQMMIEHFVRPGGPDKKISDPELIELIVDCLEKEEGEAYGHINFLTPKDKIKYGSIAGYLVKSELVEMHPDTLRKKIKKAMPRLNGVYKRGGSYYKKRV